jgi:glucose-1-phosphate cytidylyltransferase
MAVKTVILCGGQGTRIRDVADNIPKPMILIGDRPILWHIMKLYVHYGIKDFVLCLGHKGWSIKEFFLNYSAFSSDLTIDLGASSNISLHSVVADDWRITLAETGETTQTGGRICRVRKYLNDVDLFCITYGDGVADINIDKLIAFHKQHGHVGTVTGVRPAGRFGVMETQHKAGTVLVRDFQEKPQTNQGWINGGFFVFDHRLWNYVDDHDDLVFEHEPLSKMAQDGELVMYEHDGFWQPMDTYREWKILNELWSAGRAPWRCW